MLPSMILRHAANTSNEQNTLDATVDQYLDPSMNRQYASSGLMLTLPWVPFRPICLSYYLLNLKSIGTCIPLAETKRGE